MAKSKCSKCDNTSFELAEHKPKNSKTKIMFIQCSACGSVFGTMDQFDIGFFVKEIAKKLGIRIKSN